MKHLGPKQEYIDRYDKITIEDCRRREQFFKNWKNPSNMSERVTPALGKMVAEMGCHFDLLYATLDWWGKKEATISEWMHRDERKDQTLASARPPQNIRCQKCYSFSNEESRTIWDLEDTDRVLFFFKCPNGCLPMQGVYENGDRYQRKPHLCPDCNKELKDTHSRAGEVLITISTCDCGYNATDEMDLTPTIEEPDPEYETDRARFCLTSETAKKPLDEKFRIEGMKKLVEGMKEREDNKSDYEAIKNLQKLTVFDLEKHLVTLTEESDYAKFQFGTPDMGKDLLLSFSAHDTRSDRTDRESIQTIQKLLKKALEDTNWRLMTEGVSYRLGIVSGRLRAYEREEDLLQLVRKKQSK